MLLIDEAQDLSPEVLEQIRLISNLETDTEKLIQIVLIGQSELPEMLARRELRQLAQRVTARYHLPPLSRQETDDYVRHRLAVAGGAGKVALHPAPRSPPCTGSRAGIPRLINLICDRALLAGYVARHAARSTRDMVRQAAAEAVGARTRAAPSCTTTRRPIVGGRSSWPASCTPWPSRGRSPAPVGGENGPATARAARRAVHSAAAPSATPRPPGAGRAGPRAGRLVTCRGTRPSWSSPPPACRRSGAAPPSSAPSCARTCTRCGGSTCRW